MFFQLVILVCELLFRIAISFRLTPTNWIFHVLIFVVNAHKSTQNGNKRINLAEYMRLVTYFDTLLLYHTLSKY